VCESITLVPVTESVLHRAADAFPTAVGTTQAIHLATLLELQATHGITCMLASADDELLRAAESMGFSDALKISPVTPESPSVVPAPVSEQEQAAAAEATAGVTA